MILKVLAMDDIESWVASELISFYVLFVILNLTLIILNITLIILNLVLMFFNLKLRNM